MTKTEKGVVRAAMRYWDKQRHGGFHSEYVYRAYIAGWKAHARHAASLEKRNGKR